MGDPNDLVRLYDALAKWQWMLRPRLKVHGPGAYAMHKRLKDPTGEAPEEDARPSAGAAELPQWIGHRLLRNRQSTQGGLGRVLDVGCGFGATLLHLAKAFGVSGVGITSSGYQVRRARQLAKRFGLQEQCAFKEASFDQPIGGRYEAFVAVEALFHARDLDQTLHHIAHAVGPAGHGLIIEDVAEPGALEHPAGQSLGQLWHTPRFPDAEAYEHALQAAGLEITEDIDLSGQVGFRSEEQLQAAEAKLSRWRKRLPQRAAQGIIDAFVGGIDLERLYAARLMKYRCLSVRVTEGGQQL